MKKTLILTASVLAISLSTPALSDDMGYEGNTNADREIQMQQDTRMNDSNARINTQTRARGQANLDSSWDDDNERQANNMNDLDNDVVRLNPNNTATNLIGKTVYNQNGDRVAEVQDIILDRDGEASLVVLGDGDFTGLGKQVAFDYTLLSRNRSNGELRASIDEQTIDQAEPFAYNEQDAEPNARIMQQGSISLATLLEAGVTDAKGEQVATVDNITMNNGRADQLVLGFNKILGFGGDQLAIDFEEVDINQNPDSGFSFQLSSEQTREFKAMKGRL